MVGGEELALCGKLGLKCVSKSTLEKRFTSMGIEQKLLQRFDECKPGLFGAISKDAEYYWETLRTVLLQELMQDDIAFIGRGGNFLLYGLLKNNAVGRVTLPDTEVEGRPVIPSKLKPINRNSTWKIFALTGTPQKALLIDIRGNVTLLEITKRRWKKIPVLTVDRTGM
jgi:hypothetical protein